MDSTEFTRTGWYTIQETALTNLCVLMALVTIAGYALLPVVCVSLIGAL